MKPGLDSAYAPTLAQAQAARAQGYLWWGCYIYGTGAFHLWTPADIAVLRAAGFLPLPIVVPAQNLSENPTAVARAAVAAAEAAGMFGALCFDFEFNANPAAIVAWAATADKAVPAAASARVRAVPDNYTGNHYYAPGVAHWDPLPGRWTPKMALSSGQAVQYASATVAGVTCDLNMAADDFPLGTWTPNPQGESMQPTDTVRVFVCPDGGRIELHRDGGIYDNDGSDSTQLGHVDFTNAPGEYYTFPDTRYPEVTGYQGFVAKGIEPALVGWPNPPRYFVDWHVTSYKGVPVGTGAQGLPGPAGKDGAAGPAYDDSGIKARLAQAAKALIGP